MNLTVFKYIAVFRVRVLALALLCGVIFVGCEDNTSEIGSGLTTDETKITLDSIHYSLDAESVEYDNFDARSGNLMLGNLNVKEYGSLDCSFVTRFMCATKLNLPDSLVFPERVDSCKLRLVIKRGDLVGDSITPQKLAAFKLTKQLPDNITNSFNPEGFFNPSEPLGTKSFTSSLISAESDSVFLNVSNEYDGFYIDVPVDKEIGKEIFTRYKENPEVFQWPQTFAEYFPGIYVNSFFGKGCVTNVKNVLFAVYYYYLTEKSTTVNGETVKKQVRTPGIIYPFTTSPEVLSSNNISYKVSDFLKNKVASGESVITTPGGFLVKLKFPAAELINRYNNSGHNLSMINNLFFSIPAEEIENNYGIGVTPSILLIKSSEVKDFFAQNKLPDDKTSFTGTYNTTLKSYVFTSMRDYILDMVKKGSVDDEDVDFTIVPVDITSESEKNSYSGAVTTYVTKCTPYTSKPTMTRLHTEDALIVFSFSSQYIK